jgi:hypothetical protein
MFKQIKSTINRYLTLIGDQQIIDQRTKELFEIEKDITEKLALCGNPEAYSLAKLSKAEQIKLLRGLLIEKALKSEYVGDVIKVIELLENQPPHAIKHDHLYNIPVLSEIGDIIRCGFWLTVLTPAVIALMLCLNPGMCKPIVRVASPSGEGTANNSQVCNAARAFDKFFYNYKNK